MTHSGEALPRELQEIHVKNVRFLREHDGKPERVLKSRLVECLKGYRDLQRAYLAQVSSGGQPYVALCLRTGHGPDQSLLKEIGAIFAAIFVRQEHLDILFVNEAQESALKGVCAPFFSASAPGH